MLRSHNSYWQIVFLFIEFKPRKQGSVLLHVGSFRDNFLWSHSSEEMVLEQSRLYKIILCAPVYFDTSRPAFIFTSKELNLGSHLKICTTLTIKQMLTFKTIAVKLHISHGRIFSLLKRRGLGCNQRGRWLVSKIDLCCFANWCDKIVHVVARWPPNHCAVHRILHSLNFVGWSKIHYWQFWQKVVQEYGHNSVCHVDVFQIRCVIT
jgi:hypothetical protein